MKPTERLLTLMGDVVFNKVIETDEGSFEFSEDTPGGDVLVYRETDKDGETIAAYYLDREIDAEWHTLDEYSEILKRERPEEPDWFDESSN